MSKSNDLMNLKLLKFYEKDTNLKIFLNFITKEQTATTKVGNSNSNSTALRTLDWFATNYTKYKRVNINGIDIQSDYRQRLKAYQKEFFDPFRRKTRIILSWKLDPGYIFSWRIVNDGDKLFPGIENNSIVTTIGQLNFFKWVIERDILKFIQNNMESIQESQNKFSKSKRKNQTKGTIIKNGSVAHKTLAKIIVEF
jgi:hypothetical protein